MSLPHRFKTYAQGHVELVKDEYILQMMKWKGYINTLADAQIAALQRHKDQLKPKDESWIVGIAMFALSFVGGQAIGWIGGMVTKKLAARYSAQMTDSFANGVYQGVAKKYTESQAELASKFWGDGVEKVIEHSADKVFKKMTKGQEGKGQDNKPTSREHGGLAAAIMGNSLQTFKTKLDEAFYEASLNVWSQLAYLHAAINQSDDFGLDILKILGERYDATQIANDMQKTMQKLPQPKPANPQPKTPAKTPEPQKQSYEDDPETKALWTRGKSLIDEYFNKLRETWAKDWFYYGHNPEKGNPGFIRNAIEVEIWKLWVLGQEFRVLKNPENLLFEDKFAIGKDRHRLNEDILKYLYADLGETYLYDLYYKVYRQRVSKDIESETDLAEVKNWAKIRPNQSYIRAQRRNIPAITNLKAIFGDHERNQITNFFKSKN